MMSNSRNKKLLSSLIKHFYSNVDRHKVKRYNCNNVVPVLEEVQNVQIQKKYVSGSQIECMGP